MDWKRGGRAKGRPSFFLCNFSQPQTRFYDIYMYFCGIIPKNPRRAHSSNISLSSGFTSTGLQPLSVV